MSRQVSQKMATLSGTARPGAYFSVAPSNLAHRAARTLIEQMAATLAAGGRIEIRDFGAFSVRRYLPTIKRNPKTGESVAVGPKAVVHFRPGKQLRDRLNGRSK